MTLTAQQPLNNVVRVTVQTLAAVLGGCQSLHTNSFDEALGLPTNEAATIALRTQQIVAHESGVADFVDALGGALRHRVAHRRASSARPRSTSRASTSSAGWSRAIEQGYPQREIQNTAYQYQLEIERKQRLIVGQNAFTQEAPRGPRACAIDPKLEQRAGRAPPRRPRATRGTPPHAAALEKIERAARGTDNLLPLILEAVKAEATVGEISDVLRAVWGEHVRRRWCSSTAGREFVPARRTGRRARGRHRPVTEPARERLRRGCGPAALRDTTAPWPLTSLRPVPRRTPPTRAPSSRRPSARSASSSATSARARSTRCRSRPTPSPGSRSIAPTSSASSRSSSGRSSSRSR